jgi:transcriptional regulator of acetoin/glycerol metabolism
MVSRNGRGETQSTSTDPSDDRNQAPPSVLALALVSQADRPDQGGRLFPLSGLLRLRIGRGEKARLTGDRIDLPDPKASRDHAALERGPGGWRVRDLGSRNGTSLDGAAIDEAQLEPGQLLRIGHCFLTLVEDAGAALERLDLKSAPWPFATFHGRFAAALDRLERIAASNLPVLIQGETGTGKEVVARAIHNRSGRPGSLMAVNCGALPADLVESHLFGHQRGAFSGAVRDEIGFVRGADRGTLFLDELGDLPPAAQATLLRVLQEGEVAPVGASKPLRVDIRVIAATHRPLDEMVRSGRFREDLFARIAAFSFTLPSLRERRPDLGILIAELVKRTGRHDLRIHSDAFHALFEHDWPRNVRELSQVLASAAILTKDGIIRPADLPDALREPRVEQRKSGPPVALSPEDEALRNELSERLQASGGNVTQVAKDMGKARQQIQRWMRRLGLARS